MISCLLDSRTCLTRHLAWRLLGQVAARHGSGTLKLASALRRYLLWLRAMAQEPNAAAWGNVLGEFRAGLPMSLWQTHMSRCHIGRANRCGVCALAHRGMRWMAITKVDMATFPYSWLEARAPGQSPAWGMGCRICRLHYNPNSDDANGGPWAQLGVGGASVERYHIMKHKRPFATNAHKRRSS